MSATLTVIGGDGVRMHLTADGKVDQTRLPPPSFGEKVHSAGTDERTDWRVDTDTGADGRRRLGLTVLNISTGVYCFLNKADHAFERWVCAAIAHCRDIRRATPAEANRG